jgi:hypothetical protein
MPDRLETSPSEHEDIEVLRRRERSRRELEKLREHVAMADAIVLEGIDAGLAEDEVATLAGFARSTVREIIASRDGQS